jgi:hypothetical protein
MDIAAYPFPEATDILLFDPTCLLGFPYKYGYWAKNGHSSLSVISLLGEK